MTLNLELIYLGRLKDFFSLWSLSFLIFFTSTWWKLFHIASTWQLNIYSKLHKGSVFLSHLPFPGAVGGIQGFCYFYFFTNFKHWMWKLPQFYKEPLWFLYTWQVSHYSIWKQTPIIWDPSSHLWSDCGVYIVFCFKEWFSVIHIRCLSKASPVMEYPYHPKVA